MDTVLECLDAKSRNAMEAMLKLLGGIAGSYTGFEIDLKDLFSLGISTIDGDFMKLKITDIKITDSKNATVTTTMELTGAGVQTIFFSMVYEHEGWYIRDMSDKSSSSGGSSTVTDAFYVSTYSNTALSGTAGTYTTYNREKFDVGTKVVLEASANDGFNFEGWYTTQNWSSICLSTNPRYEFEMKAEDVNIEARFSYYTVTTSSSSDEQGTAGTYTKLNEQKTSIGKTVVLEATVNDGFNFEGWYMGDVCMSTDLRYEFEMEAENVYIEARYSYYTVTTFSWWDEYGTAGTYTKKEAEKISVGETVTLVATVNSGYRFEGWFRNGVCVSKSLTYTFKMDSCSVDIEAAWSEILS